MAGFPTPSSYFKSGLDGTSPRILQKYRETHGDTDFVYARLQAQPFYALVNITAAQMLALNATPQTIIAAPGAGYSILVQDAVASITYNSAAYSTNASGASLFYTDGSGTAVGITLTQAFLQASADASLYIRGSATALIPTANAPIVLKAASTDPTTGNSVLKLQVWYRVIPNPLPTIS